MHLTRRVTLTALASAFAARAAESEKFIPLRAGLEDKKESFIGPNDTERRIRNVTRPGLRLYPAPKGGNGTFLIVAPGGGFRHLAIEKEGNDVAKWANSLNISAAVLEYRVTLPDATAGRAAAAEDGIDAVKLVRANAAEWRMPANKIGMIGFSAGGYVAVAAALETGPAKLDFAVPIYPAAPKELKPTAEAPPLFIALAHDDFLDPLENGIRVYSAWKKVKGPAELHIYAKGGHGFGMRKSGAPTDQWLTAFEAWLRAQGLA